MKTKRYIFSMVIFLLVFWISILSYNTGARDYRTVYDSPLYTSDNTDETPKAFDTAAANAREDQAHSYGNRLYLLNEASETEPDDKGLYASAQRSAASFGLQESVQSMPDAGDSQNPEETAVISDAPSDIPAELPADEHPEAEPEETVSKYADIGISIANDYVNIRKEANTKSSVLGKLYRNSAAKILETVGEWYYVESGSVKGYLKSEYLKTGIPDEELIEKYGIKRIRVGVDGLNVREAPDIQADKLTVIYKNEKYPVIELLDEWVKADIQDDRVIGYVKKEYVEILVDFKDAVSKEEEQELLRLKEEERIKKETAVKYRDEMEYTREELKLLACLVHSEAGDQSYEGKLAVANIVLNRVKSKRYPNTIYDVIYQPGQFTVAKSGSLAKQLANYENYSSNSQLLSIKAAKAALKGANNIGNRLYFHTINAAIKKGYDHKQNCVKLQDHLFW